MKKRILVLSLVLALVVALVAPTAALAQGAGTGTGTTLVSGDIEYHYTITVPDPITLGPFVAATDYEVTGKSVTVSTNDGSTSVCGITVKDAKTNKAGYLTLNGVDASDAVALNNQLKVKGGNIGIYAALGGTGSENELRASNTAKGEASMTDFAVKQTIAAGDLSKTAGTYKLTMTFTATFD